MPFTRYIATLFLAIGAGGAVGATDSSLADAANRVDRLIEARLQQESVAPVGRSSDAEFCRRVWLDLVGVAPPVAELRAFLNDRAPTKRQELIDRLLVSPLHANHMATRWTSILLPPDAQAQPQGQQDLAALHRWLTDQFRNNVPYDYLVAGFLTAGGAADSGPAVFYTSRSLEPEKLAAATAQVFLGLQLQCAECHDHPFDRWTQQDFWHYAAFFSQLTQSNTTMGRSALIEDRPGGEVTLPGTDKVMEPRYPGVSEPPEPDPNNFRRRQLTIWMASRDNPYLARAAVNRVWHQLFGRGLVEPVDQMDKDHPASHPELLDFLSNLLIEHRFDLKTIYAVLARTDAYQRTSRVEGSRPAEHLFAAMMVKTLCAEQFIDSVQQNVYHRGLFQIGQNPSGLGQPNQSTEYQIMRQAFLDRMRSSDLSPGDYPHGVVQVLGIMHGPEVSAATDANRLGLLAALQAPFLTDADRIETLFLATLSRPPDDQEADQFAAFLQREPSESELPRTSRLSDMLWVLLNTAECATCP
jgi:hypothetical protein